MKRHTFRSRRMVGFFRAGYPADAPSLGHVALLAMCPGVLVSFGLPGEFVSSVIAAPEHNVHDPAYSFKLDRVADGIACES